MTLLNAIMLAGPMEQFEIMQIIPFHVGNLDLSFTNSSLWMVIGVAAISLFMFMATRRLSLVPGRTQSAGESFYIFIADMLRGVAGSEGMKFFPYIFTLFMFIFASNLLGLWPSIPGTPAEWHTFTPTSHLIVTFALGMVTFTLVVVYGFYKNGLGFLKLFVPSGVPILMLPLITIIEIVSFLSRPISLGIRLFANMLAGHLILKIFATFVASLLVAGPWAVLSILPFMGNVAVLLLELLIAFLQAYVFAILSCIYINDAIHPSH